MKTMVSLQQQPLYITKPSPWNPRSPTLYPKTLKNPYLPAKTWKLHAEGAKGFNRKPASTRTEKISIGNGTVTGKSYGNNNDDDEDEKMPDIVMERMVVRILVYVGVPLVSGIAMLQVFDIVKEQHVWDVPLWLPFFTTFVTFGASTLGVAYGTLSTSWDPEKKGSLLGFEEAQTNWVEMWREEDDSKR
ncbi:uncharacterized protein PAM68-like [Cornus florida]|uniref:uncharacterized protein PAM68-like n=1 Tax=Cornus florida TaxID=4283 RepID=UPI0028A1D528|nr:uncharacterized protein PAM68-like [Cornus florida]